MRKGKSKDKECCKSKVVLFLASLIMLIALALGANAAISCNLTTSSPVAVGGVLNATFNTSGDGTTGNMTVAFEVRSVSTANSTFSLLGNITNTSNLRHANLTIGDLGIISLEDSNEYIGRATCYMNASGGVSAGYTGVSSEVTGIVFDRGNAPSTPTNSLPNGRQTSRTQTIQVTVNGANTTGCTLRFIGSHPGSTSYAMTHSDNNCSISFSNLASTTFRYTVSASDGTNSSAESDEATFYVDIAGTSGAKKFIAATGGSLPQASPAQQKTFGQQAEDALDNTIKKAPINAQQGLTKTKEAITNQYQGKEAFKTWSGTGAGCILGALGLVVPPMAIVTIPVGCILGHLSGMIV